MNSVQLGEHFCAACLQRAALVSQCFGTRRLLLCIETDQLLQPQSQRLRCHRARLGNSNGKPQTGDSRLISYRSSGVTAIRRLPLCLNGSAVSGISTNTMPLRPSSNLNWNVC